MKNKSLLLTVLLAAGFITGCASEASLKSQARISEDQARQTALARVPTGTVKESELEKEHGKLIWSFDIATPDSKDITEVAVNAISGEIVSVERETPKQQKAEKD